ncbi:unnamed protein product [Brugia timori]|uniref:Bm8556 n=2 Tax=Brugia TaxID=6278 RepID=A0A1I9G007_BRUMA|nr:Bm8556 [Brugia malayi]VDO13601.1 unnamed protein product [Brugia timori]
MADDTIPDEQTLFYRGYLSVNAEATYNINKSVRNSRVSVAVGVVLEHLHYGMCGKRSDEIIH